MNEHVDKYSKYVFEPVESGDGNWQLAHEDGDMKVCPNSLSGILNLACIGVQKRA